VTYVADTHFLVYFATGDLHRLSRHAIRIFRRAVAGRDRVHVPVVCFFEMGLLIERNRIRRNRDVDDAHAIVERSPGFVVEPLIWEDVRVAQRLAALIDPFDRFIAGTAERLDAPLITADERIRDSGLVRTVW
jgi:PIN domain nuclease of toxin-antitoxin system